MSSKSRKALITIFAEHLFEKYNEYPQRKIVEDFCKSVVLVWPSLKQENSTNNGIVILSYFYHYKLQGLLLYYIYFNIFLGTII